MAKSAYLRLLRAFQRMGPLYKGAHRTLATERDKANFVEALALFVDEARLRPNRIRGPVLIHGSLHWDRKRRKFVQRVRKNTFEQIRTSRVVSHWRLKDIEIGLVRVLMEKPKQEARE